MSDYIRIGEALVKRGVATEEQVAEVLAERLGQGDVPLGRQFSERFGISETIVDEVNVNEVLMPRFRRQLLSRLLSISRDDKFAKGMDVKTFVVGIATRPENVEVREVVSRRYDAGDGGFSLAGERRGFVTNMHVRVSLRTQRGQNVEGRIQLRHDGLENRMTILDDEKHIRESVYYGLRTAFRAGA